ncbi:MAG: universal stress protein [Bacteroidales bacterium]
MKNILVAIDFSDCSLNALHYAVMIANKFNSDLTLIHVCKPYVKSLYYPDTKEQEKISTEKKLKELVSKYEKDIKGKISYKIREGKVYKEVINQAKYNDSDLLVAGAHGISGFEEFFIGSNAFRLITASPCPTLTITADFNAKKFERILLPIDNSIESRQKTMFTTEVAQKLNATVNVLGVFNSTDNTEQNRIKQYCNQVINYLGKHNVNNTLEFSEESNIADASLSYAEKTDTHLISIMSEANPYALKRILGSNAYKLVHHSKHPVLCLHTEKEYNYPADFSGTY